MNDGQLLLRAIIAYPEEKTPRLMYADLLDEHDGEVNAARARLIKDQCTSTWAANRLSGCEDWGWVSRQQEIARRYLRLHGAEWLANLGAPVRDPVWIHGFVERASLPPTAYRRYGSRLHAATPLRRVRFESPRPIDLGRLARLEHFADLAEAEFRGPHGPVGIDRFAASPNVRLRCLVFDCPVSADEMRQIARSSWAPELQALKVTGRGFESGPEVARLIDVLCGGAFRNLRELHVCNTPLDRRSVAALGRAEWSHLVRLAFTFTRLGTVGARALIGTPLFRRGLVELALAANELTDADVAEVVASPGVERLVSLALSGNQMTTAGALALAAAVKLNGLGQVDASHNRIGDDGLYALCQRFGRTVACWPQFTPPA